MRMAYRVCEVHFLLCTILGRKQVPHGEQKQEQLHRAPDRVVLVTRLYVAHRNGRAGYPFQVGIGVVQEPNRCILYFVEVHLGVRCREGCGGADGYDLGDLEVRGLRRTRRRPEAETSARPLNFTHVLVAEHHLTTISIPQQSLFAHIDDISIQGDRKGEE